MQFFIMAHKNTRNTKKSNEAQVISDDKVAVWDWIQMSWEKNMDVSNFCPHKKLVLLDISTIIGLPKL